MGIYAVVCTQQEWNASCLERALKHKPAFAQFCEVQPQILKQRNTNLHKLTFFFKVAQKDPECRQLGLSAFLIKPFQRITKVPLLLRVCY